MRLHTAEILKDALDEQAFTNDPLYHAQARLTVNLFEVMDDEMERAGVNKTTRDNILRATSGEIKQRNERTEYWRKFLMRLPDLTLLKKDLGL